MLTPQQLQEIAETMQPVLDDLNTWIVKDIVKRVMARMQRGEGFELTATDISQAHVLQDIGGHIEDLQRQLVAFTKVAEEEVLRVFQYAGMTAYAADAEMYRQGGLRVPTLRQSPRIQEILQDTFERTQGELRNYTRTTATATQQRLFQVLDKAHIQVMSGATSYATAFREAIDELVNHQALVRYPTGHTDTLEVAVLRAVRTGTAQASGNMSIGTMEQYGWEIVLTSAHLGARYGDGGENPGNHFWWQGRFFSRTGKDPHFPDFIASTGYGTGEGLCGWNCRHSFGPGDGKHNPWMQYDAQANKEAYDLSQQQRKKERDIRSQTKKVEAYKEAVEAAQTDEVRNAMQEALREEQSRLTSLRKDYGNFCDENGLKKQAFRLQVARERQQEAREAYYAEPEPLKSKAVTNEPVINTDSSEHARLQHDYSNIVPVKALDYPGFAEKFNGITGNEAVDTAIHACAKDTLTHRNGTHQEDLYLIDGNTGETIHALTTSTGYDAVRYDPETLAAIDRAHGEGRMIIALHNHPNGLPPTLDDGVSALAHGYDVGIVVGHNLEVWKYSKTSMSVSEKVCSAVHEALAKKLQFEFDFDDSVWYTVLRRYGMEVERK